MIATVDESGGPQEFVTSGLSPEVVGRLTSCQPDRLRMFEYLRDQEAPLRVEDFLAHLRSLCLSPEQGLCWTFQGTPMRHRGRALGKLLRGGQGEAQPKKDITAFGILPLSENTRERRMRAPKLQAVAGDAKSRADDEFVARGSHLPYRPARGGHTFPPAPVPSRFPALYGTDVSVYRRPEALDGVALIRQTLAEEVGEKGVRLSFWFSHLVNLHVLDDLHETEKRPPTDAPAPPPPGRTLPLCGASRAAAA